MTTLSPDTGREGERVQIELLQRAPAWRKLALVAQLNQTVRLLALEGLRQRHPYATSSELERRFADLCLGPELAARVYDRLREKVAAQ
jgi:hypothetical protein